MSTVTFPECAEAETIDAVHRVACCPYCACAHEHTADPRRPLHPAYVIETAAPCEHAQGRTYYLIETQPPRPPVLSCVLTARPTMRVGRMAERPSMRGRDD